MIVLRCP